MTERDDRLPTATLAEYLRAEANLAATPTTALAGAVFAAGRADLLRQAADRLEELTAAVDAVRAEERERCAKVAEECEYGWQPITPIGLIGKIASAIREEPTT